MKFRYLDDAQCVQVDSNKRMIRAKRGVLTLQAHHLQVKLALSQFVGLAYAAVARNAPKDDHPARYLDEYMFYYHKVKKENDKDFGDPIDVLKLRFAEQLYDEALEN